MQRFIPFLLAAIALGAVSFASTVLVRPESYFEKGSKLNFSITSENGAKSYSVVKIKSVIDRGSITEIYAEDQREDDLHKSTLGYRLTYFSDSLSWCADAFNHLNIPLAYSSNFFLVLESDSLVYPYAMKVGDTLRPASASEKIGATDPNERYVRIINRKVVATEKVAFGGQNHDAFRIEAVLFKGSSTNYGALGKIPNETKYTFTEWFVPSKGVVKSELKSATGVTTAVLQ
jgi:hypothetical protein